ncbi:PAS domain S-box-containing protein [Natronobacterium texcoconense]|uniref:PAS domain S-box-containing protein n=2 Tax=Natronobacterium texcoconense TaxID=1095778 RepID=A0A1H1ES01_NATTX|nr:PAS domain S-box-containing protein [Natronobacterium texcoconense]
MPMDEPNTDPPEEEPPSKGLETESDDLPPEGLARRVFDVAPVSTVVIDSGGAIEFANERATETLGFSREEITSRRYGPDGWEVYDDTGAPISMEEYPVSEVLETGEPVFGFEHWFERSDGSERWLTLNSAPLTNETGEVEYVVVAFEDVTELKRREEQLTSEHMRFVEFRTDESAVPPSLRVDTGEWRIEVESVVSLPDGATVQYMGTSDLSASEFVTAVEEVPHYVDVRLLSTAEGYSRVEARAELATVSEVFQSLGGRPRSIVIAHDEVRFLGELPGDVDPRLAADGIREFHPEVELVSQELVYSPHLLYDVVVDELTDRQFAALEAAYFSGYFDTPRTSTGGELADRFDVTRQTFNQHLRKAQRIVLQQLYEKSGAKAR